MAGIGRKIYSKASAAQPDPRLPAVPRLKNHKNQRVGGFSSNGFRRSWNLFQGLTCVGSGGSINAVGLTFPGPVTGVDREPRFMTQPYPFTRRA